MRFLEEKNPLVPSLAKKLFKPGKRDLTKVRKQWLNVIEESSHQNKEIRCIYSDEIITKKNLALDHFLPWNFVCHDRLWNITPTTKAVHEAKSNSLPDCKTYMNLFVRQQFDALSSMLSSKKNKTGEWLQDYMDLLRIKNLANLQLMSYEYFHERLDDTMKPLVQIARSMGFSDGWML
ncbi:MAG: HNH endonuclease domain-containing protein [Leptospirales bacterium]